jgi:hypothetical protein
VSGVDPRVDLTWMINHVINTSFNHPKPLFIFIDLSVGFDSPPESFSKKNGKLDTL